MTSEPSASSSVPQPEFPEEYLKGIALFNCREFYHAHEEWEELWKHHSGAGRDFYKGIIQIAVAFLHWQRANPKGAIKMWKSGSAYLVKFKSPHMGIELDSWLGKVDSLFSPWAEHWTSGNPFPQLDTAKIPELKLE
jgi:hypothetical protein